MARVQTVASSGGVIGGNLSSTLLTSTVMHWLGTSAMLELAPGCFD